MLAAVSATALLVLGACGDADVAEGDDMAAEGEATDAGDAMADGDATADGEGTAAEDGDAMAEGDTADTSEEGDIAAESCGMGNGITIGPDGVAAEVEDHSVNANLDGDVTVD